MSSLNSSPRVVCITGGIGSGKSTAANIFRKLGIGVYNADESAKRLMIEDPSLRHALTALMGQDTYDQHGQLNRPWIAQRLFQNDHLLKQWNALVHPCVVDDFQRWLNAQNGVYVIKETAILFETKGAHQCAVSILITAPEHQRIERIIRRESWTKDQVLQRLKHQWSDEKKAPLADYVIENLELTHLSDEVQRLHDLFIRQFSR